MKKIDKFLFLILIILVLILISSNLNLTGHITQNPEKYSYTKAICDKTMCQDYIIECNGKTLTGLTQTGFMIQNKNYPATNLTNEEFCD